MPVSPTYPGVYVQEVPSGVRTIVGVATSITLFVGRTKLGPMNEPTRVTTYSDFARAFGEDNTISDMGRYVKLFFLNGGADCYVMRVAKNPVNSGVTLRNEAGGNVLRVAAKNPGSMGDTIRTAVTYSTQYPEATFNMEVFRWETDSTGNRTKVGREDWKNLSMDPTSASYAPVFLSQKSSLINATDLTVPAPTPGFSIARRVVPDLGTDAGFRTGWEAVLGAGASARHKFQISVDGNRYVPIDLDLPAALNVGGLAAPPRTTLAGAIATRINNQLAATLVPAPAPVVVTFEAGPGTSTLLKIASGSTAVSANRDVRIISSTDASDDLASAAMLGEGNGGTEVGAYAASRPAPTGITYKALDFTPTGAVNTFAGLLQTDLTRIVLDELDPAGNHVPTPALPLPPKINLALATTGVATAAMWNDASGINSFRGVAEKLGLIRDAINNYQAGNASKFFWKAELWGSRLAILPTGGGDNDLVAPASFSTSATDLTTPTSRFNVNVRYYSVGPNATAGSQALGTAGFDGTEPGAAEYDAAYSIVDSKVDLFNLLVIPPDNGAAATPLEQLWPNASVFCAKRRAFLIMDCPDAWDTPQKASTGVDAVRVGLVKDYSAIYFPRLNTTENGLTVTVGGAGALAGLYARIDGSRGVWKAPAGTDSDLRGVSGVDLRMSDAENGQINPVGVNALRIFPDGVVSWGARTMAGSDVFASEYKYIPIRRLALFIEESLYRGLKWVVFEPNDVALWTQIRLNAGSFMHDLFRKGAFQGTTPTEAYFVKVDAETTTQNDRNLGIVNVWVGFAPLKPAEFVILYLQQIAGQLET
jgi:Bacteriophage tail sheath protein